MDLVVMQRVRELLARLPHSQREVSTLIDSTPDKLSKSLSGKRRFTATELASLAELGGTTVDHLLTGVERPVPSVAARSAADETSAADVDTVAQRFSLASDQLDRLSGRSRRLKPLPVFAEQWSYVAEGEELAAAALAACEDAGVRVVDSRDLVADVERVFDVDVAVTPLPVPLDGAAWTHDRLRLILLAPTAVRARQRFTLAHELGHVLAADAQHLIAETAVTNVPPGSSEHDQRTEKRANTFAACFLVPEEQLRAAMTGPVDDDAFAALVARFAVSPATMSLRLQKIGMVPAETALAWRSWTTERCLDRVGQHERTITDRQDALTTRLPHRLVDGHLEYFLSGRASVRPVADLLGVPVETILGWRTELGAPVDEVETGQRG